MEPWGDGVRQWLKRVTPSRSEVRKRRELRVFGKWLRDPGLWHLDRRSVAGACALGLFVMYLPPLGQMLIAAAGAIVLRVNLPVSVALVWITNPLTIPPMYYFAYVVGSWILDAPTQALGVGYWFEWRNWLDILLPLTIGSLVCGAVCSLLGYVAVQALWRWSLLRRMRRRARYAAGAAGVRMPSSRRRT